MHRTTSGNSALTSFPTVMFAITFFTASFFFACFSLLSSALSSKISPFFVVVKYLEPPMDDRCIFAVALPEEQPSFYKAFNVFSLLEPQRQTQRKLEVYLVAKCSPC
eukprot:comp24280_c1_seq2/m.45343 comp24280_c1_seq2/g.45343  ORF comp24280_c1_seq2/g.45343 comp24280_c1_seq2/m.45343 type:complete len:107 (+) comp24280_c1_seq2:230-550(+)